MKCRYGFLTDLQCKRALRLGEATAKSDGNGLTFTISAAGCATWVLRYRFGQRRYELTLGRYPDLGLAEARSMAALTRADVLKGVNPAAEKRKAKNVAAKDWTVRQLIGDYRVSGQSAHLDARPDEVSWLVASYAEVARQYGCSTA